MTASDQPVPDRTGPRGAVPIGDLPPAVGAPGAAGSPAVRRAAEVLTGAAGVPPVSDPGRQQPSRALWAGLMAGMPIIALLLFLWTDQWWFFLLIPLTYAVLGPMMNNRGDSDTRKRQRNRDR